MQELDETAQSAVSIDRLISAANVSERTLRNVFYEYFGVGPIRYLQLRRLHEVRKALKAADVETKTVASILAQHGEWAFSRFADRYRKHFGESPSDTLRR